MLNICIHCEFERGNFDRSSFEHSKFGLIEGEGCRNIGTGQLAVTTLKHCPIGSIYIAPVVSPPPPFISNAPPAPLPCQVLPTFQCSAQHLTWPPAACAKPPYREARPRSTRASPAGSTGADVASTCPPAPRTGESLTLMTQKATSSFGRVAGLVGFYYKGPTMY